MCLQAGHICETPREKALAHAPLDAQVAREFGNRVMFADFTDAFCDAKTCPVIRNGLIAYLHDDNHLTATFAASFAPRLAPLLQALRRTAAIR
jgi:SGNH domain (fused to AT3 domains)